MRKLTPFFSLSPALPQRIVPACVSPVAGLINKDPSLVADVLKDLGQTEAGEYDKCHQTEGEKPETVHPSDRGFESDGKRVNTTLDMVKTRLYLTSDPKPPTCS